MKPLSKSVEVGREESYFRFASSGKEHLVQRHCRQNWVLSFPKALGTLSRIELNIKEFGAGNMGLSHVLKKRGSHRQHLNEGTWLCHDQTQSIWMFMYFDVFPNIIFFLLTYLDA